MALDIIEPGKQLYTIYGAYKNTNQKFFPAYNSGAILTTDHDAVIEYAADLVEKYGDKVIYTVAFVTPVPVEAE